MPSVMGDVKDSYLAEKLLSCFLVLLDFGGGGDLPLTSFGLACPLKDFKDLLSYRKPTVT